MEKYSIYATLEIHVEGEGASEQDVLDKAVAEKNYEVISSKMNVQPVDNYISLSAYAKLHNIGDGGIYLRKLCQQGVIRGALKIGRNWAIPEDTVLTDRRYTQGGKWSGWYEKHGRKNYEKRLAKKKADAAAKDATEAPE